ncbi:transcriptional regulator, AraC family protein [Fimbriimonas ginsengisoli Gsoil 348]|uniref:Transcriptional regulator, AraC family protein n=1 Tax=Fimbriimonas ginsengisoli Gsoil 348 TaxID=661478 RepID=A0A068NS75_FIMGI|nr:transcriptional regulator, AraC family protein [Fimbriimonas ginsengisoli Gsoil 348]
MRTGSVKICQGSAVFDMGPGMILLHPPFVEHADSSTSEYSIFYVQIDAPADAPWPGIANDDSFQSMGRICEATCREWKGSHPLREEMIANLTQQTDLLLRRFKTAEHRSKGEILVAAAERILEERYNLPITAAELASELGVSRSLLYAEFTAVTGQTPKAYVLRRRLEHATAMLQHTNFTLERIAAATGFYSSSHLARHVKASTHQSPGTIRKLALARNSRPTE